MIDNRRIVELPLNGRNYLSLIAASPNVSVGFAGAGQAGDRQGGSRSVQQYSIAGQRREFNYFTLDGVDNTDVNFNTYIFLPSVDALEEFKVQTGIYSAEFGRAAGQVNVVTKSGSNALHGTVFEFHRNDKFDSRIYAFTPAQAAAPKPAFQWNQYGFTVAGPVARNRVFFMSNFEGFGDDKTLLNNFTVPTAAMRSGDFSAFATPLLDPATCTVAGGVRSCQTFPGNRIPANRIHPTSTKLLEFYPEPNAAGTSQNYLSQVDRVIDRKQYTQRMDFNQSSALNWMGRYSWSHDDEVTPALKLNGTKLLNTIHQLMIGNTFTVSPTVLNEFRFGYNSFFNTFGRELAFVRDVVKELGIPGVSAGTPEAWGSRPSASPGTTGSATTRKAPTPTGTRCSNSPTTCPGSAAHTRSRLARPSGSIGTTRWATSSRAVRSRSTGGPPARRSATRRPAPPRSPTCCWATCAPPNRQSRWRAPSSARSARRTTSPTRGACGRT